MPDELLSPLLDDLGLHQRAEGSHDAYGKRQIDVTGEPGRESSVAQGLSDVAECLPITSY